MTDSQSQYFYNDETGKCKVVRDGSTPKGEPWFTVLWKANIPNAEWIPYLFGTAEFLGLSDTGIKWAEANAKK